MSKKISTIFLSLFLVGILSVSCSNKDTTDPKGIEQYNGNIYVSTQSFDLSKIDLFGKGYENAYMWVSIQDSQIGIFPSKDNNTEPVYQGYFPVTGSGTDYSFSVNNGGVVGTLQFSSDGSSVTVNFTKNTVMPSIENTDIVCNKK
ncbi:hypothetical protein [Brachyspira hampsonii]|uniref:Lipoprotein n=1 Tax=Brachyspira hampsonii TaxID=1287055 RepID=A0AAC9TWB3_9SPIR|nr:hypothetical protein [Brachyspira hampsonii]ASJ22134.1 hypothetical protein BHAMNSH16_11005 [Brachyspira hampsonii]ELV05018.1 hypothetical protein H263_12664 [Brachyspira hampsonii 30599]MBW5379745.1 hypothetical protein [Brachyspira hampsonii]OEJ18515.1 hypothetical protein A9496_07275 [Brachyspira hampsonii]